MPDDRTQSDAANVPLADTSVIDIMKVSSSFCQC